MTTTPTTANIYTEKDPAEVLRIGVDFRLALQSAESIVSAVWTATTYSGVDPSPSVLISGIAVFAGAIVYSQVQGGLAGCVYKLKATVQTTKGNTLVGVGFLPVG